jgi:hypothetical protein
MWLTKNLNQTNVMVDVHRGGGALLHDFFALWVVVPEVRHDAFVEDKATSSFWLFLIRSKRSVSLGDY